MAFDLRRLLGLQVPQQPAVAKGAQVAGATVDNRITNRLVGQGVLPANQAEVYPQTAQPQFSQQQVAAFNPKAMNQQQMQGGNISFAGSNIGRGLAFEKGVSQVPQGMNFGSPKASQGLVLPSDYSQYGFDGLSGVDGLAPARAPELRPYSPKAFKTFQQY